jgi:L-alanine-DL-glutamate epimerase-like enolase superfamily enzyme
LKVARIERVDVCVARVPLADSVAFSTRAVQAREYCLVRVASADGHMGVGYSYAVNTSGRILAAAVEEVFAPRLIGQDSLRVEGIWRDLYQEALLIGRAGAVMRALSAVDIALWDLNARSVGLPLYKYLGAVVLDRVPAYGSGGYYMVGKSNDDLAEEMLAFVRDGYEAVKIKVGRLSPAEDAERLHVVREAIGSDIHLMLDANNAWTDLPTAMRYIERFEKYSPYWIEEPFLPDDIDNHAALAQRTSMMVATGEIEAGRWRFKDILDKGAAAILQADAIVCGGISEFRKIAATAASYGVPVAPHAWHDIHVHLVASTVNATYVEFMPDDKIVNFRTLIDVQIESRDGHLLLPDRPGLGFSFDPAAIDRYGVRSSGAPSAWHRVV